MWICGGMHNYTATMCTKLVKWGFLEMLDHILMFNFFFCTLTSGV